MTGYNPVPMDHQPSPHWTKSGKYGAHRPIAVIRYRNVNQLEDDLNLVALTPGNRWTCSDPVLSEGEYGYTAIYNYVPTE